MTTLREQPTTRAGPARVEAIDNWHAEWPRALELIDRLGQREQVGIDPDGWLPARRRLLVAFVGDRPVGHLSFRIEPVVRQVGNGRQTEVVARVESCSVDGVADAAALGVQLETVAREYAHDLSCVRFEI